jgi:hypothetical protein
MKKISLFVVSVTFLCSCDSKKADRVSGRYKSLSDEAVTKVSKVSENEYEVQAEFNSQLHFKIKGSGQDYLGELDGKQVKIKFSPEFDTMTGHSGENVFISTKIAE